MHNHKKAIIGYAGTFNHSACLGLTHLALLCNNRIHVPSHVGPSFGLIKYELKHQSDLFLRARYAHCWRLHCAVPVWCLQESFRVACWNKKKAERWPAGKQKGKQAIADEKRGMKRAVGGCCGHAERSKCLCVFGGACYRSIVLKSRAEGGGRARDVSEWSSVKANQLSLSTTAHRLVEDVLQWAPSHVTTYFLFMSEQRWINVSTCTPPDLLGWDSVLAF